LPEHTVKTWQYTSSCQIIHTKAVTI
ncbi:hypothetical protein, partial [Candidatus Nitrosotalea sp. FS]